MDIGSLVTVLVSPSLSNKCFSSTRVVCSRCGNSSETTTVNHLLTTQLGRDVGNDVDQVAKLRLYSVPACHLWAGSDVRDSWIPLSEDERVPQQDGIVLILSKRVENEEELSIVGTSRRTEIDSELRMTRKGGGGGGGGGRGGGVTEMVSETDSESEQVVLHPPSVILPGLKHFNSRMIESLDRTSLDNPSQLTPPVPITSTESQINRPITSTESQFNRPITLTESLNQKSLIQTNTSTSNSNDSTINNKCHWKSNIVPGPSLNLSMLESSNSLKRLEVCVTSVTSVSEDDDVRMVADTNERKKMEEVVVVEEEEEEEVVEVVVVEDEEGGESPREVDLGGMNAKIQFSHPNHVNKKEESSSGFDSGLNSTMDSSYSHSHSASSSGTETCGNNTSLANPRMGQSVRELEKEEDGKGSDEGIVMEEDKMGVARQSTTTTIVISSEGEEEEEVEWNGDVEKRYGTEISCCGMRLSRHDLCTLKPNHCVNDQVINCYMRLLQTTQRVGRPGNSVLIASTFFYTKLCQSGRNGVTKWMKNVEFRKVRLFLVPIHLPSHHHWSLVAVHIRRRVLEYYDSMGGKNAVCMKRILSFLHGRLQKEAKVRWWRRRQTTMKPTRHSLGSLKAISGQWRLCYPKGLPRQSGIFDCGVFMCQFARWLCYNRGKSHSKVPFTQSHMFRIRDVMAQELKNQKLCLYLYRLLL